MIEIQSVSKKFGTQWVLKDVSWSVRSKKALGLLGPNGAGKSTTMKLIMGLHYCTEGEIFIDGENVLKNPLETKRKIGYLPENPFFYGELKVYDYLDFICGLRSVPKKKRTTEIEKSVEKLNLQEVTFKSVKVLSRGFRQRVGIAQSLIGNPGVLILDEPSAGLDPQQVFELRNTIKDLKKDHTVILSTHVLSEVEQICDEVVILSKGCVKTQCPLEELLNKHKNLEDFFIKVTQ